jgi:hypothetical protein
LGRELGILDGSFDFVDNPVGRVTSKVNGSLDFLDDLVGRRTDVDLGWGLQHGLA